MQREGCRLTAYLDSVGVPTIGVGHTGRASPPSVHMGMTITQAQAETIFAADLAPFEAAVNAADLKGRLSQNAYNASVSLAFNIGAPAFSRSTVARCIANDDMAGAADAFLMWNKPAVLEGRRKAERAQFLLPDGAVTKTVAPTAPVTVSDVASGKSPLPVDADKPVLASIETAINTAAVKQGAVAGVVVPKVASPGPLAIPPIKAGPDHAIKMPAKPGFWHAVVAAFTPKTKA